MILNNPSFEKVLGYLIDGLVIAGFLYSAVWTIKRFRKH
jgi:hypothetical protein